MPPKEKSKPAAAGGGGGKQKDEGKYFELPGAVKGKVVVRFPPEASGYLHIGHAKAALLNAHYQRLYEGKLVFRFDDTNPEKEKESFEKIIEGDVELLEIKPDHKSCTSDWFELMLEKAVEMIKNDKAYVDDTPAEQMKSEREQKIASQNRVNTVEKNLSMWQEMVAGSELGQTYCLRAKIDMTSDNGCLRDPTIYRCKPQEHPKTGYKYKVYPTYDFACPIVDSVEGITHALRTSEYMDRDHQFNWFCDVMNIRKPAIASFSRLNLMNTVLSKRKLTYFVQEGIVDGWDDPRMPTVRGVLRRGLTVEGLQQFIASQGSSKSVVVMEWDKIWSFNRKVIDPKAHRYSAVEVANAVPVILEDTIAPGASINVALHPKLPEAGTRAVPLGSRLLIDQTDAQLIVPNTVVTFINWGNVVITGVEKNADGLVTSITSKLNLANKVFNKIPKVTWLEPFSTIPALLLYFDHLIKKPVLGKDDDFKEFINRDSLFTVQAHVDLALKDLKKGSIIQIQRKGFFIVDEPYSAQATVDFTGKPKPIHLISIPNGSNNLKHFPKVVQEWRKANAWAKPAPTAAATSTGKTVASASGKSSAPATVDASKLSNEIALLNEKLAALKLAYKQTTKKEWTPSAVKPAPTSAAAPSTDSLVVDLDAQIRKQGDLVRKLKGEKAPAEETKSAVGMLLALKAEFKKVATVEWKPDYKPPTAQAATSSATCLIGDLDAQIRKQGDLVRKLKGEKAPAAETKSAVDKLLALKEEFKKSANVEWKPDFKPPTSTAQPQAESAPAPAPANNLVADLDAQIRAQGDLVRKLKGEKAPADEVKSAVDRLLALKTEYKTASGADWKPDQPARGAAPAKPAAAKQEKAAKAPKEAKQPKPAKAAPQAAPSGDSTKVVKKQTRLGLETSKAANYSEWYTEVITKGEMIEYYDVSGCYILRPWSFAIWEAITAFFDAKIKSIGVKNCYFPMFVSKAALEKEKEHIADFAPEVAWVTKSGDSELDQPIAIRPTSETVMYPSYAKWVQSYRDLPIQLNQWCNVVRWEFKQPTPFLRTREFLWQEGHSAFATEEETMKEVLTILDFYASIYEELLAVPVIKGRKTEKEKFAGGVMTTTIEAYVDVNGRGIQGATSHYLGQKFSAMFDLSFEDPDKPGQRRFAHQTSWGLSTRTIGAMIMIHGDEKGLVLPPRVAALQVVIVPCGITAKTSDSEKAKLVSACHELGDKLAKAAVKVKVDDSELQTPGWKFNHWELKGVPIRVELGPQDLAKQEFVTVRRDSGVKKSWPLADATETVKNMLEEIHASLFARATKVRDDRLTVTESWTTLLEKLEQKFIIMAPFCGAPTCEEAIKRDSAKEGVADASGGPLMGAKSLCIPFQQPKELAVDAKCIHPQCTSQPKAYTLFGRSY